MLTAALALSLTAIGCKDEKQLTPPPPASNYLAQSSVADVLANLQTAYEMQSLDQYRKLFAAEFTFVFNPANVNNPTDPTSVQGVPGR